MLVGALDNIARISLSKNCGEYDAAIGSSICGCADGGVGVFHVCW